MKTRKSEAVVHAGIHMGDEKLGKSLKQCAVALLKGSEPCFVLASRWNRTDVLLNPVERAVFCVLSLRGGWTVRREMEDRKNLENAKTA